MNLLKVMKYIKVDWPEIQDFMFREDFSKASYFDSNKNAWFVPDFWEKLLETDEPEYGTEEYFDRHDCWDAVGGDWQG